MLRHWCFIAFGACALGRAAGLLWNPVVLTARDDLVAPAAWDVLDAECVTAGDALVDALAKVRPRPRLAPRTPAAMAVPASGREILMWSPRRARRAGAGDSGAGHQVTRRIQ
jgi:hypothetical protein